MQVDQALQLLGLEQGASAEQIEAAQQAKQKQVEGLWEKAPTDGLKDKYRLMLTQLDEAKTALQESTAPVQEPRTASPLSQTKFADLPGANPFETQLESGAAAGVSLREGQVLANRYEVKEQIGAGGMGAVYCAYDQTRDETIAIKVLAPALLRHEKARERFLDEARLSSRLSHPGIVNVFDVQKDGDFYFLTMELLEGQSLRQYLDSCKHLRQEVPVEEAVRITKALCETLTYAHKQTVHRDIKPENIWLCEDGEIKLMDFGIARLLSTSQRTQTGTAMGTAYYMAPEQLRGGDVDGRADQYALGVLLYEMLTGEVPMGRMEPVEKKRPDAKNLSAVVDKMLSVDAGGRFESTVDVNECLARIGGNKNNLLDHGEINPKLIKSLKINSGIAFIFCVYIFLAYRYLGGDILLIDGATSLLVSIFHVTVIRDTSLLVSILNATVIGVSLYCLYKALESLIRICYSLFFNDVFSKLQVLFDGHYPWLLLLAINLLVVFLDSFIGNDLKAHLVWLYFLLCAALAQKFTILLTDNFILSKLTGFFQVVFMLILYVLGMTVFVS